MRVAVIVLIGVLMFAGAVSAVDFNGHSYFLTPFASDWFTTLGYAESQGGYLVCIGSSEENAFIASTFADGSSGKLWIGFTDVVSEGDWKWINGEPTVYTNWNGGEPNNVNEEDFSEIMNGGAWNDTQFNYHDAFGLVEKPNCDIKTDVPEPISCVLGGLGMAVLGIRRRLSK